MDTKHPPHPHSQGVGHKIQNVFQLKKSVVLFGICNFDNCHDMAPFKSYMIQRSYNFLSVHQMDIKLLCQFYVRVFC